MIPTVTQERNAIHFGYQISPSGGDNKQAETHSKHADLSNVGLDIFSLKPDSVEVETSCSIVRNDINSRQSNTAGETL